MELAIFNTLLVQFLAVDRYDKIYIYTLKYCVILTLIDGSSYKTYVGRMLKLKSQYDTQCDHNITLE